MTDTRSIAVVGSGISGLGAALALARRHDVTLFEREPRAGGHATTVLVPHGARSVPVDIGFIVFNEANYPLLTRLFAHLGVPTVETEMTFGVSLDDGQLEWCGSNSPRQIFAQRRNLVSPSFLWMLREMLRFNRTARRDLVGGALCGLTFGDYIARRRFSDTLRDQYILPMIAAIWSTPTERMLDYPAEALIRFLDNHRLMHMSRPSWRTVTGGSRTYVDALLASFGGRVETGCSVSSVHRGADGVTLRFEDGRVRQFDEVVLATHSDTSLALLRDADAAERSVLEAVRYCANRVVLHQDPALMPHRREAWGAWNYIGTRAAASELSVSYWMNALQHIDDGLPLFVTLNPLREPDPALVLVDTVFAHPQFDTGALLAQQRLPDIQGRGGVWFCGAWTGHGFHEDGLRSGFAVARALGCGAPWEPADIVRPLTPVRPSMTPHAVAAE